MFLEMPSREMVRRYGDEGERDHPSPEGEGEDQDPEAPFPVLEPPHIGGPFGLGSGDLGGIAKDEGGVMVEEAEEGIFEGSPFEEAVDGFLGGEEACGQGAGDLGDPWGAGFKDAPR